MKREGMHHAKLKLLSRDLNQPMNYVRGLLVTLWGATAISFPRGDIGRLTNEEIAMTAEHDGDPDLLVEALIRRRLLDVVPDEMGRLYIHDWHEHADDFVQQRVARDSGLFATGIPSRRYKLSDDDRQKPEKTKSPGQRRTVSDNDRQRLTTSDNDRQRQTTTDNDRQRPSLSDSRDRALPVSCPALPEPVSLPVSVPEPEKPTLTASAVSSSAAPDSGQPEPKIPAEGLLDAVLDAWNSLGKEIAKPVEPRGRRHEAILTAWRAGQKCKEVREAIGADGFAERLVERIRGQPWLHAKGFLRFPWLFAKSGREWHILKVLEDGYAGDDGKSKQAERSLAGGRGVNFDSKTEKPFGGIVQW